MKRAALIILDGLGIAEPGKTNAVTLAGTPCLHKLMDEYAWGTLSASGEDVGLPAGQMGNSEVGHMNLGAGRIVYQELGRINKAIADGAFAKNEVLCTAIQHAIDNNKNVHLMGLLSDGGVHAHIKHLEAICDLVKEMGAGDRCYIHAFTDGRDTDPKGGLDYTRELLQYISGTGIKLSTLTGRYYAMDRDKRWERVKKAYDALVNNAGKATDDALKAIEESYEGGVTDEFLEPVIVRNNGEFNPPVQEGDTVLCFNFRTDRGREITTVLTQQDMPEYDMHTLPLYYVTMTPYSEDFRDVHVLFNKEDLTETLGEVLAKAGKTQLRIAETEKYPHVTFFFSGGREDVFNGETRFMAPSPKVATYDLQPEMSAEAIKDEAIRQMTHEKPDFICLNFANPDMVGHTGVLDAVVKAVKTVDAYTCELITAGQANDYSFIIIADHGNAEYMANEDGSPNTAHTTNLVPCIVVDKDVKHVKNGKLGDIAPTILALLGMEKPAAMTGNVLI